MALSTGLACASQAAAQETTPATPAAPAAVSPRTALQAAVGQGRKQGIEISASVDGATNPFLDTESAGFQPSATLALAPYLEIDRGIERFELRGLVQVRQYLQDYGTDDNYGASGRYERRTSETVTLFAAANVANGRSRAGNLVAGSGFGLVPDGPTIGGETSTGGTPGIGSPVIGSPGVGLLPNDPVLVDDVTILGRGSRVTTFSVDAGAAWRASDRSRFDGEVGYRVLRFGGDGFDDFDSASQQVRYTRTLNATMGVGLILATSQTDYKGRDAGDSIGISPLAAFTLRIGDRLTASVAAGVSFVRMKREEPLDARWISPFSAEASLCNRGDLDNLCATVRRSPQPSAIGGIRTSDAVAVSYSRRLSPRDMLSASANYTRTAGSREEDVIDQPSISLVGVSARYDRELTDRLAGFASATFADVYQSGLARAASIGGSIGVRYRLGTVR